MLRNANMEQREEIKSLAFDRFKEVEQKIMKSQSYRKYCRIKDSNSMLKNMKAFSSYNVNPENAKNQSKITTEDLTAAIISKQVIGQDETVAPLNEVVQNLNSNVDCPMPETEGRNWRQEVQELIELTEDLDGKEETLNRKYREPKDYKMEILRDINNEEEEKFKSKHENLNSKSINTEEEICKLTPECNQMNDSAQNQTKKINEEEKEIEESRNKYKNEECLTIYIDKTGTESQYEYLKKNIINLKVNLAQKTEENEKLRMENDKMKIAAHEELKKLIQGIMDNEDSLQMLSKRLDKFLEESSIYDIEKHSDFLNYIMNVLVNFSKFRVFKVLTEEKRLQVKDILIDFLYRFKDRHPFSNSDQKGPMDVFEWIMDFMKINGFKPSKSLREEYSKSKVNKKMVLPSFEFLNEKIGMTKEVYDKLEE